jgi:hypothetical protein
MELNCRHTSFFLPAHPSAKESSCRMNLKFLFWSMGEVQLSNLFAGINKVLELGRTDFNLNNRY